MFEVVYIGAPYGLNEYGETISKHRTYDNAYKVWQKLSEQAHYYNQIKIKKDGKIVNQ